VKRYLVALLAFLEGVGLMLADQVFYWGVSLDRSHFWFPFGLRTDIWTAWALAWALVASCFAGMTVLALRAGGET